MNIFSISLLAATAALTMNATQCSTIKPVLSSTEAPSPKISTYKGKIEGKAFTNKGGKTSDFIEYYFVRSSDNESFFIKFKESNVNRDEIAKWKDKAITIKGEVRNGLWDTDNPEVQSRVGIYIMISEIVN